MPQQQYKSVLKFLIPSLLGAAFFLLPVAGENTVTIPLAIVVDYLRSALSEWLPTVAVIVILTGFVVTAIAALFPKLWTGSIPDRWNRLLRPGLFWILVRLVGAVIALAAFTGLGPEILSSAAVGGVLLNDLAPILLVLFLIAGFLIVLLTDYGLMEFIGVLAAPLFRSLFKVPGRGAIDATASWMGSATVGTLITIEQYQAGKYTGREAATVACNFSIASIGFCYVLAATAGVEQWFLPLYGTVFVCVVISAIILCRVPPLTMIPDTLIDGSERPADEHTSRGFRAAMSEATQRAETGPGVKAFFSQGLYSVASIYIGLLPSVFAIGGLGLLLAETTPIFEWLSAPLVPVLSGLGLPEAAQAAPAFIVGFADQFLTVIVGSNVESEQTRFVIAVAAITQVLYFSELGALLLQSRIPIGFGHLTLVFVLRTLITIPIAAAASHLLF
ncbi:MAG: YjiH family protein [Henriciella sp.]